MTFEEVDKDGRYYFQVEGACISRIIYNIRE